MASAVDPHDEAIGLSEKPHGDDRFVRVLDRLVAIAVRILAALMVVVIFIGVAEAVVTLYRRLLAPPVGLLEISNVFATFGIVMAVLIAIEIFHNIVLYLRTEAIRIRVVLATAMLAIARKIVVLDYHDVSASYVIGSGVVMLAVGVSYFLVVVRAGRARQL
jgi:uncharacterized membrane protein (DUF373 family)